MSLKQKLKEALSIPEIDFGNHCSDLYVVDQSGKVRKWLKENYEFYTNITSFVGAKGSDWEGKLCLDIPFSFEKQIA